MKKYTILLLLIFGASRLIAQTASISGTVTDKLSGEPIPGAFVILETKKGTTTDANGKFKLSTTPGKHTVTFKYIGFAEHKENIKLDESENQVLNVQMEDNNNMLNVVVVSSSQYQKNLTQETVSMDVIGKEIIKSVNAISLGDIVSKSPGVQVQDGQISIRGGSSYSYGVGTRTAVLVDDMAFISGDLNDAQLKFAPLEATEQVEVIKGASSVVYGSSALDGVVNLRTGWATDKPQTEISAFKTVYGDPKRKELKWWDFKQQPSEEGLSFLHRRKKGIVNLVFGGNIYHLRSWLTSNDEFRGRFIIKTKINPKNIAGLSFGLNANVMYENSDRFFLSQDLDTNLYRQAAGSGDKYLRTAIDPHLQYLMPRNNKFHINLRFFNVYRFGSGGDIDASSWVMSADIQHQKWFTFGNESNLIITPGIQFSYSTNKSNLYQQYGALQSFMGAAYLQLEYKIKRLSLIGGGRYEIQKVTSLLEKSNPVFRAGANYRVGKATFLRVSWGQGYRMPSLAERYLAHSLYGEVYVIPNRDLAPEKSWNFELGIKQGFNIAKNWKGLIDMSFFAQSYDSLIEYQLGIFTNKDQDGAIMFPGAPSSVVGFRPYNIPTARIGGYEISIVGQGKIKNVELNILAGYTYNYPGNASPSSPNHSWGNFFKNAILSQFQRYPEENLRYVNATGKSEYLMLQYRTRHMVRADIEAKYKRFNAGFTLTYNSFPEIVQAPFSIVFATLDGGKNTITKYINKHQNGDLIMDLRAGYQINKTFDVSFLVKNFTNKEYSSRLGKADAPINFTLKLRAKF